MKKIISVLIVLSVYNNSNSQSATKLGSFLSERLKKVEYAHSNQLQPLLVKGKAEAIQSLAKQYQGTFKFSAGDVCSIEIPYKNLKAFAREEAVERIENSFAPGVLLMDTARVNNNIDKVQSGAAPLIQPYTGQGVIVGIIDGGIFFQHGDFRNANGTTRIRNLWDQNGVGTAPVAYGYGAEWDSTSINNGSCTHLAPSSNQGHGTNVAGIAAGNGFGATTAALKAQYKGVAPEANLVVVRVDNTSNNFLQKIADAADYIYKKADALGMPCVINTSVGTYYGSHDGKDLAAVAIDNMLLAKKGRVFVAAAGNAADKRIHLGYTLSTTDSLFTWFKYNATTASVYYDLWADTNQFKAANFAIGCDNNTPAFLKGTKYYNILTDFNPAQGTTVQIDDSLFNGATKLGNYSIYATLEGGTYHIEFLIYPVVTSNLWRLQTQGTGTFDLWANKSLIGTSDIQNSPLPGGFTSPNYRFSDTSKTMVSSWVCSDKVITVGNYSNGHIYKDVDSLDRDPLLAAGEVRQNLFPTSSWGPTRDGRQKNNITATGSTTICTGDSFNIALLMGAPANKLKIGLGGKHNRNGGTSMAAPVVTGAVALYLQKRPTASYDEVMKAIQITAKVDAFTGTVPNPKWGYGKLDAFAALALPVYGCLDTGSINYNAAATVDTGGCIAKVYGCKDTGSINYNPAANVSNVTCIAKVYGCTDSTASNYNPSANVSNGTCFATGIKDLDNAKVSFDVMPNPFSNETVFTLQLASKDFTSASIKIYDQLGKVADSIPVENYTSTIHYHNTKLASGIYYATVVKNGKNVVTKKIVVE